jgi:hypothetical protein
MLTRPANMPLSVEPRSGRLSRNQERISAAIAPAPAANVVLTAISITWSMSAAVAKANWLPGLKPYQPIKRMKTPRPPKA